MVDVAFILVPSLVVSVVVVAVIDHGVDDNARTTMTTRATMTMTTTMTTMMMMRTTTMMTRTTMMTTRLGTCCLDTHSKKGHMQRIVHNPAKDGESHKHLSTLRPSDELMAFQHGCKVHSNPLVWTPARALTWS